MESTGAMTCPRCSSRFESATTSAGLAPCPTCRSEVVPTNATEIGFETRTEQGAARRVLSRLPLTDAFRRKYTMQKLLGRGGMGMVFEARDLAGDRPVAIKFLTQVEDADALKRFLREGELLRQLDHKGILKVLEIGELGQHPYLVTELIEGGSLRAKLQGGRRMPVVAAMRMGTECLAALAACHGRGIVHRDLKPDNIMFAADGSARLVDLGIAKPYGDQAGLTATGAFLGTPLYMAPEQVRGEPAGTASDVYAMGLTLYEALTGTYPFKAKNLPDLLAMQLETEPPSLRAAAPEVPEAVAQVVHQALAKPIDARPVSADAFGQKLSRAWTQARREAAPARAAERVREPEAAKRRERFGLAAVGVFALLVTLVAVIWSMRPAAPVEELREVRRWEGTPEWADACQVLPLGGRDQLLLARGAHLELVEASSEKVLARFDWTRPELRMLTVSPDGALLAFQGEWTPEAVLLDARTLAHVKTLKGEQQLGSLAFSADSRELIIGGLDGALTFRDIQSEKVTRSSIADSVGAVRSIAVSRDGRIIIAATSGGVKVWDSDGKMLRKLDTAGGAIRSIAISNDGTRVAAALNDAPALVWDPKTGKTLREFPRVSRDSLSVALSPDARLLLTGGTDKAVRLWDVSTGQLLRSSTRGERVQSVAFAPDGKQAFSGSFGGRAYAWQIP